MRSISWMFALMMMMPVVGWAQQETAQGVAPEKAAKDSAVDLDLALMNAVQRSQPDKVRELLAKGADPQKRDAHGQTPLMWVMSRTGANVVDLVAGKSGNDRGSRRKSMWMDRSSEKVIRILLEAKTKANDNFTFSTSTPVETKKISMWDTQGTALVW